MKREDLASYILIELIKKNRGMGKKQLADNAIAYADMLLRRLKEIPADAQQKSERGQL